MKIRFFSLMALALVVPAAGAQEWPRFRGPNGSGIGEGPLPVKWAEKDFLFRVKLPGVGHSSPVLWGKKLFLTSADPAAGTRQVSCLDADTGKQIWSKSEPAAKYRKHRRNTFASSTPAVDARRVYLAWATPEALTVQALSHDGEPAWERDLGPWKGGHGFGVSLILHEGLVILPSDQDNKGELLALDAETGKVRWRIPRESGNATYSTPCVFRPANRPAEVIFTNWKHGMTAVNPETGKVTWEKSIFAPELKERAIASPVVAGDLLLGTCGFVTKQKHLVAMRPPAKPGDKPEEVWRVREPVAYLPTPLVKDGLVYLSTEKGIACCLKATDGEMVWQGRLRGTYSGSPVCAGEYVYCTSDEGEVTVLRTGPKFEVVSRNPLGGPTHATPAIAHGRLYFRTEKHLVAVGQRPGS